MRLSKKVISIIQENIQKSFGDVNVYLFGSRTDDAKKGGDIDIAVDIDLSRREFRKKKARFLANLIRIDFDYAIDVVNYNTNDTLLYSEIRENSIKLNLK